MASMAPLYQYFFQILYFIISRKLYCIYTLFNLFLFYLCANVSLWKSKACVLSLSTLWLGPTLLWLKSPVPNLEDQIVFVSMRENGNGETVSFSFPCFWVAGMANLSGHLSGAREWAYKQIVYESIPIGWSNRIAPYSMAEWFTTYFKY